MRHHGFDKLIISWPNGSSVNSLLRLVMESLCAVILLDNANIAEAATIIGRLITPADFPPEKYGSSRIEINRLFSEMGFKYTFRDAPNTGVANMELWVQELIVNNEVVGVGVAETKESAQEAAAHEYVIGGGFNNFCALKRALKTETESISKEKRHKSSTKADYYTILTRFLGIPHAVLKKKVITVPFAINDSNGEPSGSRNLCYLTHDNRVIAAFVSDTKNDGISGCLKRLHGYLTRGEECIQAHEQEPILTHPVVASILKGAGSLTNIPVDQWRGVDHTVYNRNNNNLNINKNENEPEGSDDLENERERKQQQKYERK